MTPLLQLGHEQLVTMSVQSVEIKSDQEVQSLKISGRLAAQLLNFICAEVKPGISTAELDQCAARWIKEHDAKPAFLNYRGFPANICISINDEVVHGIPGPRKIKNGDIVSIDVGLFYNGWCGDTARTIPIRPISPEAEKLLQVAEQSLEQAIQTACTGKRLGDISYAMQSVAESAGYNVVRNYGGHGIGRALHEDPHVPCLGKPDTGIRLKHGMVLALEVMVNAGTEHVTHKPDGWTVLTNDGSLSAHFEHMVAILDSGTQVLTKI